jgi:hypothetical protein
MRIHIHQAAGGVMISRTSIKRARLLILAAGFCLMSALPAAAQAAPAEPSEATAAETTAADSADPGMKDADINGLELDWSQLNVDASTLTWAPASKARAPKTIANGDASWSSNAKANGSAAVSVKQPLTPFWDARIGADMTVARQPATLTGSELLSEKLANGGNAPQSSGSAWAAISAPGVGSIWDKTAVEARVDPAQETSKLGTSISKSVPLGEQTSLTLQNGYNVIQQGIVPVPGIPGVPSIPGRPLQKHETEQSAKLSIDDTGTSFSAGQTLSSADDRWLRKIGAEQKLFGGVSISGSIGETAQGTANKSISAGFKHSW